MFAATRTTSATVSVTIRPAVAMNAQGDQGVGVVIRLAPLAQAKLWKSEECVGIPANTYTITRSGTYSVSLSEIGGEGSRVCLASSDGSLNATVLLVPSTR